MTAAAATRDGVVALEFVIQILRPRASSRASMLLRAGDAELCWWPRHTITDSRHRLDERRRLTEFEPRPPNVDVDGPESRASAFRPGDREESRAGQHLPRILRERGEHRKFARFEFYG
jgi:hypothetical protein